MSLGKPGTLGLLKNRYHPSSNKYMVNGGKRGQAPFSKRGQAPFMNALREWGYAALPTRSLRGAAMRRTCSSRTESKGMKTGLSPFVHLSAFVSY